MASGVDKRALERLAAAVRAASSASSSGLYERLKLRLAAAALTEVALGFRESRDPYDKPWDALKVRRGKPLLDTARLRNSFAVKIVPKGFRLGTRVRYARVHQYGATIVPIRASVLRFPIGRGARTRFAFAKKVVIPQRQMVPEGRLGLRWAKAFREEFRKEFRRALGARG